jgi:hypothetical protein
VEPVLEVYLASTRSGDDLSVLSLLTGADFVVQLTLLVLVFMSFGC